MIKSTIFKVSFCILIFIVASSCKKTTAINNTLIGNWEIRESSGGNIAPHTYPPGNGIILKITSDTLFFYQHDTLEFHSYYKITNINGNMYTLRDGKSNDLGWRITLENNRLLLVDSNPDVAEDTYVKL